MDDELSFAFAFFVLGEVVGLACAGSLIASHLGAQWLFPHGRLSLRRLDLQREPAG